MFSEEQMEITLGEVSQAPPPGLLAPLGRRPELPLGACWASKAGRTGQAGQGRAWQGREGKGQALWQEDTPGAGAATTGLRDTPMGGWGGFMEHEA